MTPLEFAKQYLEMDVFCYAFEETGSDPSTTQGDWQHVIADDYRLGASTYAEQFWQDVSPHLDQPLTVRVKNILGEIEDVALTRSQLQRHFRYPFVGKGSPEQMQIAIQLTYRYHNTAMPLDQFLSLDFVGLDCNGFVGNYLQRVVQDLDWQTADNDKDPGPTTLIGDLLQAQGADNQITSLDALDADGTYLFGLCDANGNILDPSAANDHKIFGHIMITEPGTLDNSGPALQINVTEATGAGNRKLRNLNYSILSANKADAGAVFKILRGSPNDPMNVRVARVQLS